MSIQLIEDTFGSYKNPATQQRETIKRFTFSNLNGISVQVISYGATITSIKVPSKNGQIDDVVLGFDTIEGYQSPKNRYFGASVGRVCNRTKNGKFTLNGIDYQLNTNNNNVHHLHGGKIGFDKCNWSAFVDGTKLKLTHVSEDGTEGYPGTVIANAVFELLSDNSVSIKYSAVTTAPTPINMTNHSYFNLAGHNTGATEIYRHKVHINADHYTVRSDDGIPTGEIKNLTETAYDFRVSRELGAAIANVNGSGFDDNYCINDSNETINFVAEISHAKSGRSIQVFSNQPGLQFYTANFLPDPNNDIYPPGKERGQKAPVQDNFTIGKDNRAYGKHGAICLETQKYPDSVNHNNFPSIILNPGELYEHNVVYKFSY